MTGPLWEQAKKICILVKKHGLDGSPLERTLEDLKDFRLAVPLIGPFNSGKSALLNALLGAPLLPVGIVATTIVPTELTYGANQAWLLRKNVRQQIGLWDLRGGLDLAGVTRLSAAYQCPFLGEVPGLRLMDMPGLGVRPMERERMLCNDLPDPSACLLVLSADEPVVRESEAVFLRELRLRGASIYPVLTKRDKLTPQELTQAVGFLCESLEELFGLPVQVACVSVRGSVEPVREVLRGLQARAARLEQDKLAAALTKTATALYEQLRLRIGAFGLTAPEFTRRVELMEAQGRLLSEPLEAQARQLEESAASWEQALSTRLAEAARRAQISMEAMLLSGQNPSAYVDGALRATVLDSLRGELLPLIRSYLKSANALLRLSGAAVEPLEPEALLPAREALSGFPDSAELFSALLPPLHGLPRGWRQASLQDMLPDRVFPELVQPAARFAAGVGTAALAASRKAVEEAVQRRSFAHRAALEELRRLGEPDEAGRAALLRELGEDLSKVELVLAACHPAAGEVQL